VTVLLDTHTLLWAILTPSKLSRTAFTIIQNRSTNVLVSAASVWEIATKVRLGKLPEAEEIEPDLLSVIETEAGYRLLSIVPATALRAGRFASNHGDPFDRMLAAQALSEDIPIVSADPKLDSFGVQRIW
jgi:PIN domain nuclease of toxin-antitoxin system